MAIGKRKAINRQIEAQLLTASRRRCCLCYFLEFNNSVQQGQIAHLDRDSSNSDLSNLVYLCLRHHDEYDTKRSQSKGFTPKEIEEYRNKLYKEFDTKNLPPIETDTFFEPNSFQNKKSKPSGLISEEYKKKLAFIHKPWKSMGLVEGEPSLFAYKSLNRFDGVCRIERINLFDGDVVFMCEQIDGNPGMSITNAIEYIAFQLCEQFDVDPQRLVIIEHYNTRFGDEEEWNLVDSEKRPPKHMFENPNWTSMTEIKAKSFGFCPRRRSKRTTRLTSTFIKIKN